MKTNRRSFVKHGVMLGSGAWLLRSGSAAARAAGAAEAAANPTLKTLHSLRSTHGNFRDAPLPDGAVETILQASIRAANASNSQSYSIIVIKDRQLMKDVCTYQGSCLLLFCADYTRLKASAAAHGFTYDPGTVENFLNATMNATLAAQTAVVAAKSLGIDSLLTNGIHRGDIERHWKLLDLPATHCFPVIALVLGYPTQEPAYQRGRLDGVGVFHSEKYHTLTKAEVDEITRRYDDPSRHLGNELWAAKGYKHFLDWYFKEWIRVDRKVPPEGTAMLRRLKRSGFIEAQVG
jgi:nitroreductase